jgi:hypothetical protein
MELAAGQATLSTMIMFPVVLIIAFGSPILLDEKPQASTSNSSSTLMPTGQCPDEDIK